MKKRIFDIVWASIGIAAFLPVMLIISLFIMIDDGRPVLFIQERLGRGRRPFRVLKFRSMGPEGISRVGRWLRATGLDETPQFINILKGEMSMVGPRPLTGYDVVRMGWDAPAFASRWEMHPGITGLSQLFGGTGARSSWFLDRVYMKRRSMRLDACIIFMSLLVNTIGKKRFRKIFKGGTRL